jgi:RecA-family ATPase
LKAILRNAVTSIKAKTGKIPLLIVDDPHAAFGKGEQQLSEDIRKFLAQLVNLFNQSKLNVIFISSDPATADVLKKGNTTPQRYCPHYLF